MKLPLHLRKIVNVEVTGLYGSSGNKEDTEFFAKQTDMFNKNK